MRCTVSICVIVLEMIDAAEALPLLMLSLIIAKGVADRFNDSIFVKLALSVKKLPFIAQASPSVSIGMHTLFLSPGLQPDRCCDRPSRY